MKLLIDHCWDGSAALSAEHLRIWITDAGEALAIDVLAPFHADPPPAAVAGPCWQLWDHEVVELFILGEEEQYTEVELGPFGHHLVLRLKGRRHLVDRELPLDFRVSRLGTSWWGRALLPRAWLPPGPIRINAYAIHGLGESRRYLAWIAVPGAAPDFHALEQFRPMELPGR